MNQQQMCQCLTKLEITVPIGRTRCNHACIFRLLCRNKKAGPKAGFFTSDRRLKTVSLISSRVRPEQQELPVPLVQPWRQRPEQQELPVQPGP